MNTQQILGVLGNVNGGEESKVGEEPAQAPFHAAVVAARKVGAAGWEWCRVECFGDPRDRSAPRDLLFEGGVPTRKYTRGKRKGQTDWRGVSTTRVVVTAAEIAAEEARYEREENLCHKCGGSKQVLAGWSTTSGKSYRPCTRCKDGRPVKGDGPDNLEQRR